MKKTYYLNGKRVNGKKDIPNAAVLKRVVSEEHYETPEYTSEQAKKARAYFQKQADLRNELEERHG